MPSRYPPLPLCSIFLAVLSCLADHVLRFLSHNGSKNASIKVNVVDECDRQGGRLIRPTNRRHERASGSKKERSPRLFARVEDKASLCLPTSSSVLSFAAAPPQSPSHIIHPLPPPPPPPPPPPDGRTADALRICHANNEALNHVASRLDRLRGTDGRTDRQSVTPRRPGGQWRHAVTRRAALFQRAFSREASRASGETGGRTGGRRTARQAPLQSQFSR